MPYPPSTGPALVLFYLRSVPGSNRLSTILPLNHLQDGLDAERALGKDRPGLPLHGVPAAWRWHWPRVNRE